MMDTVPPSSRPPPSQGPPANKSGLWSFFSCTEVGPQKQQICSCKLCRAKFTYHGNSSVLSNHMKTRHPQYVQVKGSPRPTPPPPGPIKQEPASDTSSQGSQSSSKPQPPPPKPTRAPSPSKPAKDTRPDTDMSSAAATATPTKAKDKERIVKLLHESILHLCKVSVSGPGEIEVDGIVCITQPNEGDIVVKVHESFNNVHNSESGGESPAPGDKRKAAGGGEGGAKTPRKDGDKRSVSRRLVSSDETLDLTGEEESRPQRSPQRAGRNKSTGDVIDLTSGRDTPGPQLHISQVRSLGNNQRFSGPPAQYNHRMYQPRGGYPRAPRQRFSTRGMPPPLRHMNQPNNSVVPIGGPIPHRGFARGPNPGMMGGRGMVPRSRGPGPMGQMVPGNMPNNPVSNNGVGGPPGGTSPGHADVTVHGYKGLRCKYKDCGFSCSNKYYLETHVLQHFDSSPFSCNEAGCDYKTKNKQNLYQHYKTVHDANNPQFCFKCIKAFKSPEDLNVHALSCQVLSIKCDHCGENIQGLMAMARHLTEVYIADSGSDGSGPPASPGNTPSPGQPPPVIPSTAIPDMSAPLNIIPDMSTPTSAAHSDLVQQELEKLEQMSSEMQQQQQQQQQQAEILRSDPTPLEPPLPTFQTTDDLLPPIVSQPPADLLATSSPSLTTDTTLPASSSFPEFEVLNQPASTSEPITLQVPVDMNSDLQLPPGAEAITLELVPLSSDSQTEGKPPDLQS